MSNRISPNTAFRVLNARREREAHAGDTHAVYNIKKDGTLYAKPTSTHATLQEASEVAERMRGYNPNSRFAVVVLATGERV